VPANSLTLIAALGAILFPSVWTLFSGLLAMRLRGPEGADIWQRYVGRLRALNLLAVPAWWVMCDVLNGPGVNRGAMVDSPAWAVLVLPLGLGIGMARFLCLLAGRKFDTRHWTIWDFLSSSFWVTLSSTIPLLLFAVGIDAVDDWKFTGIFWLAAAGFLSVFATARLRIAGGFKPQLVKSGDLFKRSFAIAKQMGVPLKGVFVLPAGRGRGVNAHSAPGFIGTTDICVHRMKGKQLDFAIGHELAHIQAKHGRSGRRIVICAYRGMAIISLANPYLPIIFRAIFRIVAILVPVLVSYSISRRSEYAADRAALDLTGDPESAIRALAILHRNSRVATRFNRFDELLLTHPSLWKRIEAIAEAAHIPSQRIDVIKEQFHARNEPLAE